MIPIKLETYLLKNRGIMVNVQASSLSFTHSFFGELIDVETGKQLLMEYGKCFEDVLINLANKISVDEVV